MDRQHLTIQLTTWKIEDFIFIKTFYVRLTFIQIFKITIFKHFSNDFKLRNN